MDWAFVIEKVLSWGIPVICAAVLAKVLIPLKKAKKAQERGQELLDQEKWNSQASNLIKRIENLEEHHNDDKDSLAQEVNTLKEHDAVIDGKLGEILNLLKENTQHNKEQFDIMNKKNTTAFIQIYQRDLIVDGKIYIANKSITPQQLANYEMRYKQYKEWGGNGDVEPWIKKIRELPVHFPVVNDFNEK